MRRRTLRAAGLLVAAALTLAACARIPTSGTVERGLDAAVAEPGSVVLIAPGPQPNSTPLQIVGDYLTAAAAGLSTTGLDFSVARTYLYGDAEAKWNPLDGVLVIDRMTLDQPSDTEVTVQASVVGKVDQDGVYSETASGAAQTVTFSLIQDTTGQWRIKEAPPGLILTSRQFTDLFRRVSLFFLTPDEKWLVPDPRYYPAVNLATSAVKGLLAGPASWLRDAVATEVPQSVALSPESVTVVNGQAEVDLSPGPAVQAANRSLLVTQIERTLLGQVSTVSSVVVRAGQAGPQLQGGGAGPTTIGATDLTSEAIASDATNGDHLVALGVGQVSPVAGVGSLKGLDARTPARSEDGQVRAFLSGPSELALVPTGDQPPTQILQLPQQPNLAAPSVDRFGWVWTAATGGSTVYAVNGRDPTAVVNLAPKWLAGRHITAVRVSRDGTRVAIVSTGDDGAGVSIDVAGIARDDAGGPSQLSDQTLRVGAALTAADALVWFDDTTLAVLARPLAPGGSATVAEVPLGDHSRPLPDVPTGMSLAGGRGEQSLRVGTSDGHLFSYGGVTWAPVPGISGVRDPSYPG